MGSFTVTAERGASGAWVLECAELGVVSQTRRLDRAEKEVLEALAFQSGLAPTEFEVEVIPILPSEVETLRQRAEELGVKAKEANGKAAAARSELAQKMKAEGFTLREMGQVLGVSYQRAAELAG
ncbi:hypothetical protein HMPREF2656_01460 [Corynebacterium sp. HMSC034B08]|uniref:hypothetical protein n=1 Tax=Corynebacterium sp. HMSC034B08 TaxID=1715135 RepID=UPI0008A9F7F4|nr:hypothetical protein [Corynebacterium sp. HMSC034B08]OHO29888.1 hypothetical protein HMPREF2656_01460 [Corynebacterium sp. HMSC034B08]